VWNFRFCCHRFIALDGAYIIAAKNWAVSENFPLGGAKRFDRRYVWTFFYYAQKISCNSVVHISPHKIFKNLQTTSFPNSEKMGFYYKVWRHYLEWCVISEFRFYSFVLLVGARVPTAKKFGVSLENFPLGGINRFYRGSLWETLKKLFFTTVDQTFCHFVENIGSHKMSKICKQHFFLTRWINDIFNL